MKAIRRVAIVSCSIAVSLLMSELSIAQSRIIRSGSRTYRVVPSSSARAQAVSPSRSASSRAVQRYTPRPTVSSRSSANRTSASRVLAKKAPASESTNREKAEQADSDIPASALLTERGMELVAQLKRLRYAEATLGSRHPSMPGVQEQIVSIRRILKSWGDEDESNASSRDEAGEPDKEIVIVSESVLDALSKDDLKQLVVRLAADVSKLRRRIDELQDEPLAEDEI